MPRFVVPSACLLALSLPAGADPLLAKMRAVSSDGPVYAYEMTYQDTSISATGQVDPSQPEGQRIQITSPDPDAWPDDFEDELKDMDADTDGDIWCASFAERVPDTAELINADAAQATYAFVPIPDADADGMRKKMMKQIKGEITVDAEDGAVLGFQMRLPKPYKPAMVAKINAFEMTASCARAPDGRTYIEDFSMQVSGSAMMQSFEENISRRITKLIGEVG
ncbi:MAG: hypothetical protein QNI84_05090 [Henriciella sp.]|nr:hypothetical protein [Henriciella sp.]